MLEEAEEGECIDAFYKVACETLPSIKVSNSSRQCQLHQSALSKLVVNAQKFCRYDPGRSIQLREKAEAAHIPLSLRGFVWDAGDFHRIEPVGFYLDPAIRKKHIANGIGIPVVITRFGQDDTKLMPERSHFDATIRLNEELAIEFYDPHRITHTETRYGRQPIHRDTTASLVAAKRGQDQGALRNFIQPLELDTESRLYSLEPYQPGKVPLILIHGLLSSPFAWAEMINELRATPGFNERFQIWVFEYPTGQSFLASAASLREQLFLARNNLDPRCEDPCFSQMVLVGHSMGGLVAKLQVTCSEDVLWRAVANRPFDEVQLDPQTERRLATSFFFQPSPDVKHVIFMGTPHRGSGYARRLVGRVGSALVSQSEEVLRSHRNLIDKNPGVFNAQVSRRIPTSIDMLEPSSDLLEAIRRLPIKQGVQTYSIIGDSTRNLRLERSDGVVPISSARLQDSLVEYPVSVRHSKLNKHPDSIHALLKIIDEFVVSGR